VAQKRKLFTGFHWFVLALALLIFLGCLVLGLLLKNQKARVKSLEERLSVLTETTRPVKFMLLSRSNGTITARFRFYDTTGKELAVFEQSWPGEELILDSVIIPAGKRFLAFPCRFFTDAVAPKNGTAIFDFYDRDGFPAIYDGPSLDAAARRDLVDFFALARAAADYSGDTSSGTNPGEGVSGGRVSPDDAGVYGNAVHDLKELARFESGVVYALEFHRSGAVEIRED
jgi:hypothetical protein